MKYIQSELNTHIYSGFNKEDPFFKMHTFRASKDLSENHDEIYEDFKRLGFVLLP